MLDAVKVCDLEDVVSDQDTDNNVVNCEESLCVQTYTAKGASSLLVNGE